MGTTSEKLAYVDFNAATRSTGVSGETVYIPLKAKYLIERIDVTLGEPMASGDSLNIDLRADEDVSATDWGTMSYAVEGAIRKKFITKETGGEFEAENFKMILNFNGGAVKIKKIDVWGTLVPSTNG